MTDSIDASRLRVMGARQELESHPSCEALGELRLLDTGKHPRWVFACAARVDSADPALIPSLTRWVFVVDCRYPFGKIDVYPAIEGGIATTFPHQDRNDAVCDDKALQQWARAGDVCLKEWVAALRRAGGSNEPCGARERLSWYFDRLVCWAALASRRKLTVDGEPFELPTFRSDPERVVGYSEDNRTFGTWSRCAERVGRAELVSLGLPFPYVARSFRAASGRDIATPTWGRAITESKATSYCPWLMLPAIPTLHGYATPATWGELQLVLDAMGVPYQRTLRELIGLVDRGGPRFALVGFCHPQEVGQPPSVVRWQPLQLPMDDDPRIHKGFRDRVSYLMATRILPKSLVTWFSGRNWNAASLQTRGSLSPDLRSASIALIGAGAIGSAVAELLVRGGAHDVLIIDGDRLVAGNLARHTLSMRDVGDLKAEAVAARLNLIHPHAKVTQIAASVPYPATMTEMTQRTLILDCTADDDVIAALDQVELRTNTLSGSLSMGIGSTRGYLYFTRGSRFGIERFRSYIQPWLAMDAREHPELQFPLEEIGCWHPVFPATTDVVWGFAAAFVSRIDSWMREGVDVERFSTFERSAASAGVITDRTNG